MSGSHELWLSVVNRILGDSPRILMIDVCCGACAVTRKLDFSHVHACDVLPRSSEFPEGWGFTKSDAYEFLIGRRDKSVDLVVCSDGLEHLTKGAGRFLFFEMCRVGRIAVIFTPTGDTTFNPKAANPHTHKSSWGQGDFSEFGWETEHFPDWHPTLGWGAIFAWKK